MSEAKVQLGRRLFHDTRLSVTGAFACATCHVQARAFTDGRPRAAGATGQLHPRSTMTLANVAYHASYGWADASTRTLEAQMLQPMFNEHPIELGLLGHEAAVVARLAADPEIAAGHRAAFPEEPGSISMATIVKAIAAFERTLVSGDSALDRYLYRDDRTAMTEPALRGMRLFFSDRLACSECHGGFNLSGPTDFEGAPAPTLVFHHTALYNEDGQGAYPALDRGLIDLTGRPDDMGRFRAPTLRNIALTAPYMHDGSVATLPAVVAHYATGGHASRLRHPKLTGFQLTRRDTSDLVAFLEALTDAAFVANQDFAPPSTDRRN